MKKSDVIHIIFGNDAPLKPAKESGVGYAPTNIALCKYWGKSDTELNLPITSSLSIALPDKGARTTLTLCDGVSDEVILNGKLLEQNSQFVCRLKLFLDLFRENKKQYLRVDIQMNLPVAAGLASSACGFASLALALNDLCEWQLSLKHLSMLARLGSGSAARSFWNGFVEWHAGEAMASYAEPIPHTWSDLRVGLLTLNTSEKPISSRDAMQRTVETSMLYDSWPKKVSHDLALIKEAIQKQDFHLLGATAESNALAMHATMLAAWPPISFSLPETLAAQQNIWQLRRDGLALYFTQDAGSNLKLLFLEKDEKVVKQHFPMLEVLTVF